MKFSIHLDSRSLSSKPDKTTQHGKIEISDLVSRITSIEPMEISSLDDFAQLINDGHSFTQAVFNGPKDEAHWVSQQIFCMDFDSKVESGLIISKTDKLEELKGIFGAYPNITYDSFSNDAVYNRFRVIYVLDMPIHKYDIADEIHKRMKKLDGVDKSISPAHFFYPGTNAVVTNGKPFQLVSNDETVGFFDIICTAIGERRDQSKNRAAIGGLGTHLLEIYKEGTFFANTSPIIDSPTPTDHPFDYDQYFSDVVGCSLVTLNNKTFVKAYHDKMYSTVEIYRDFVDGVKLSHHQIFSMATNLHWFKGGIVHMQNIMKAHGGYKDHSFEALKCAQSYKHLPTYLKEFSTYEGDKSETNMISAIICPRGFVQQIKPYPELLPLSIAEAKLKEAYFDALGADTTFIYLLKLPTGIGKTQLLVNMPAIFEPLIAIENHALKDELRLDIYNATQQLIEATPELPTFKDPCVQSLIEMHLENGGGNIVQLILETITTHGVDQEDEDLANRYLKDLKRSLECMDSLLTTHYRALRSKAFDHNTIIFDEDPLNTKIETYTYDIKIIHEIIDALEICMQAADDEDVMKIRDLICDLMAIRDLKTNTMRRTPSKFRIELLNGLSYHHASVASNILRSENVLLCEDRWGKQQICISKLHRFPDDKKVIVMSASIDQWVYTKIYGDRVKVIDLSFVESVGKVVQYTRDNLTRSKIKELGDGLGSYLNGYLDMEIPTITYKMAIPQIRNADKSAYFGKCSGYNHLKGKSTNVVGTPHKPEFAYMIMAMAIGLDVDPNDHIKSRIVKSEYHKFRFASFEGEELSRFQLHLIATDILQATGRSRTLRYDCTVYVYSNLPIPLFEQIN